MLSCFLLSCKHKEQHIPLPPLETEQPAKSDTAYFRRLAEHAKKFIPDAFQFKVNKEEEYFTVSISNFKICTLTDEVGVKDIKSGVHTTEYALKDDDIKHFTFVLKYSFKPKRTAGEQQKAEDFDEALDQQIFSLDKKYPNSHLWTGSIDYKPKTKEEKAEKQAYYKEEDSLRALFIPNPNFSTPKNYSVFIKDNLPKYFLDCDTKFALALATMKKNLEDELSVLR